ncbi:Unknown protein, partial [Striga hermonthica]
VSFPEPTVISLAGSFDNALILKFSFTVPSLRDLSVGLVKLGFKGRLSPKFFNYNHYLLFFELKEDYNSVWIKTRLNIFGCSGRVFKYITDFTFVEESPIVPVWCCFLGHLPHLFDPSSLFSIASCIGNPIETDAATANRSRLSVARVCMEIDLRDEFIKAIELDQAGKTTIQKVVYERVPPLCTLCSHVGHGAAECYTRANNPRPTLAPHRRVARQSPTVALGSPKEKGKAPAHSLDPKGQKGKGK